MRIIFLIYIFFVISNCSLNLVDDHHGVFFLEKKMKKISTEVSNKNDIISILGEPSTKSSFDNDIWIYIERKISNTHFMGRRQIIVNNVLILEIDTRGILTKKDFYDLEDMKNIKFDKNQTQTSYSKKSFIYNFLASMRQKVNDPLGKRKQREDIRE